MENLFKIKQLIYSEFDNDFSEWTKCELIIRLEFINERINMLKEIENYEETLYSNAI